MPGYYTWPEDGYYLVVCTAENDWPHAFLFTAPDKTQAKAMGKYKYQTLTGADPAHIAARVTAAADLPEIMFGEERVT